MRNIAIGLALLVGLSAGATWAQDIEPLSASPMPTSADYWAAMVADRIERQNKLEKLIETMTTEMVAIRLASDGEDRERRMAAHRKHMREALELMRDMGGRRMREVLTLHMGSAFSQGTAAAESDNMQEHPMEARPRSEMSDAQRLSDLENRVDMMQVIFVSLMELFGETSE